jgi:DNA-directed RNA polymerase subunit M/transcription elongation factor TFIIS
MKPQPIDQSKLIAQKCHRCSSKLIPAQMIVMSWINYDCPKCGHVAPKQLQDVYEGYDDSMADFST